METRLGTQRPSEGVPDQSSLQAVRKGGGLRPKGTRRSREDKRGLFHRSPAHPVSTRLPQAPLRLGFSAKTGPAKLLNTAPSWQTTTSFSWDRGPRLLRKTNQMQISLQLCRAWEDRGISCCAAYISPMTSELLTSLLPPNRFHAPQGASGWPFPEKSPN